MKASTSLKYEFNKTKKENEKLSKEVLGLKSSISKFHKRKETLDTLLTSQKFHGNTYDIGYEHRASSSSSS